MILDNGFVPLCPSLLDRCLPLAFLFCFFCVTETTFLDAELTWLRSRMRLRWKVMKFHIIHACSRQMAARQLILKTVQSTGFTSQYFKVAFFFVKFFYCNRFVIYTAKPCFNSEKINRILENVSQLPFSFFPIVTFNQTIKPTPFQGKFDFFRITEKNK